MAVICEKCGARNLPENKVCRRCKSALHATPIADSISSPISTVLEERWEITESLPHHNLFLGVDRQTRNRILIRQLDKTSARDRTIRSQFLNEARLIADLESPHFVKILAVISDAETPALVMASPEGVSLAEFLKKKGPLPIAISVLLLEQLLGAVSILHQAGITHRNLNPQNIYIGAHPMTGLAHLTITDFTLANSIRESTPGAETGTLIGMKISASIGVKATPYIAPELLIEKYDFRSDIYAAGVIFFEMLTHHLPLAIRMTDEAKIADAIRTEPPASARMFRSEVPKELDVLIQMLLAKNPNERPIDCESALRTIAGIREEKMSMVPRGPFLRGCAPRDSGCRFEETPAATVELSGFFIDRFPVTVAQFRNFINMKQYDVPEHWYRFNPPEKSDHPVVFVNYDDCKAYAKWAGKRLPTEAEWEKAARSTDERIFPWGNELPTVAHAHFDGETNTSSVGQHVLGKSPYEVEDLSGNVFEWVSDWYSKNAYRRAVKRDPQGPSKGSKRILKGGSFVHGVAAVRISSRGRYKPEERRANHGFRCVWSMNDLSDIL